MKFWPLLWGNLKRRKARTVVTLLSIMVAFILFSYLAAVKVAFEQGQADWLCKLQYPVE